MASDTISISIRSSFDNKGVESAIRAATRLRDAFGGATPKTIPNPIPKSLPADAAKSERQILALAKAQAGLFQATGQGAKGVDTLKAAIVMTI